MSVILHTFYDQPRAGSHEHHEYSFLQIPRISPGSAAAEHFQADSIPRDTRPCNGRVAAIRAAQSRGRRPFVKMHPPAELGPKAAARWQARSVALEQRHGKWAEAKHITRVSRAQETSPRAISWAIPQGSVAANHTSEVWRSLLATDEFLAKRADRKSNTAHVLWAMLRCTDFRSMTCRITWATIGDKIVQRFGPAARIKSRATIGSILFDLRAWGLVGIVASGRSAECSAKAGQEARNEAPVYVMTRPIGKGLRSVNPDFRGSADSPVVGACGHKMEPLGVAGLIVPVGNSYTREANSKTRSALPKSDIPQPGETAIHSDHRTIERTQCQWPGNKAISTKRQCLTAAAELARKIPILRRFSKRDLRSLIFEFTETGWTIADLHIALDNRPDPGPRGNFSWAALPAQAPELTSVDYSRLLRGAIKARLNCWRTATGEIMNSNSQRQRQEQAQLHTQARAAAKQRAQHADDAGNRIRVNQHGAEMTRAAIRAAKRRLAGTPSSTGIPSTSTT